MKRTAANQPLQATLDFALLFFLPQLPSAPEFFRWTTWMKLANNSLFVAACLGFCGCHPSEITLAGGPWEYSEVSRTKSPDTAVDAVVVSGDGGATTATECYLYLVPAGRQVNPRNEDENRPCFTGDHLKGLKLNWRDSHLLEIQYDEARIHHFQNMWQHREVSNFQYVVELRLAQASADVALPLKDKVWQ